MTAEHWRRLRPEREDGLALVLAVLVVSVMTIMVVGMIGYTSASSRDASLKDSGQRAYALAEAGLNQGLAQLASHYYDSTGKANNSYTAFDASWFTGFPNVQESPTSTAACTSTSTCMRWSVASCSFDVPISGCSTSTFSGTTHGTIVVEGRGTVPNPTGASALNRTITAKVDVTQPPQLVDTPRWWTEIYTGAPATGSCDLTLGQGVTITAPLYVAGDLCLTSSASISGANTDLKVLGWTWLRQSSTIGSQSGSPPRVKTAQIAGGCSNGVVQPTMSSGCAINKNAGSIWDSTPSTQHAPTSPTPEALPTVDWAWVQNAQASSVPAASCTNGRSLSELTFALTPNSSYTCTSAIGSIKYTYNNSGVSTLVISGDVYLSGSISIDTRNALVQYSGVGSLFVAGSLVTANNSFICVQVAAGTCDFANATNSSSSGYWDPAKNLLLLQVQGAVAGVNLRFQGGIYSATSIALTGGQGCTQGPLVTPNTIVVGQQLNGSFPNFPQVPAGSLGAPPPPYNLTAPYGGTY